MSPTFVTLRNFSSALGGHLYVITGMGNVQSGFGNTNWLIVEGGLHIAQ